MDLGVRVDVELFDQKLRIDAGDVKEPPSTFQVARPTPLYPEASPLAGILASSALHEADTLSASPPS